MRKKEANSKQHVISFRIDDSEKEVLLGMAAKSGDSISNLLRRKLNLPLLPQMERQKRGVSAHTLKAFGEFNSRHVPRERRIK
ncbi:hypothetical protein SAMN02745165_03292 [Malonomonas rubra DSM 5091]|jgi:hypothetical protein|uniref:Ribbon-helix-helix protein, copG family n=1 Tax=Malonomonas rubra DSM 5091 TaxID=1122189 RepID=A0A1M6MHS4_MALRU|nr:hypothetical protein [Malonomonas rubra]SHJ83079.1 hypothetical protein SAMN02745165_03292 [Malonomonas rubra DSM 5091]